MLSPLEMPFLIYPYDWLASCIISEVSSQSRHPSVSLYHGTSFQCQEIIHGFLHVVGTKSFIPRCWNSNHLWKHHEEHLSWKGYGWAGVPAVLSWDFPKGLETYLAQEYIQITSKRDFSAFFTSHFCAICFPCRITGSPVLHSAVCFILLYLFITQTHLYAYCILL